MSVCVFGHSDFNGDSEIEKTTQRLKINHVGFFVGFFATVRKKTSLVDTIL